VPSALEITGDLASAATALAGLVLVFMGSAAASFDAYQRQEQQAVRARFQTKAWIAFVGFILAVASAIVALWAKWLAIQCLALLAFGLLLIAFIFVLFAALSTARGIR
jgi:hypothetical protein